MESQKNSPGTIYTLDLILPKRFSTLIFSSQESKWFLKIARITKGHFTPFCEIMSECPFDIFLLFVKTCENDLGTFSSCYWKPAGITYGHFPSFLISGQTTYGHFPPFLKICQNDLGTFSSILWNFVRMTGGHFPPFCENLSEWQWDIFLLFMKTCQNDSGTFSSFLWKLVRMTVGHFPPFLENLSE